MEKSDSFYDESVYENDVVAKAAFESFGIRYLYPWQRMVIANILEAFEFKDCDEDDFDSFCKGRQIVLLPTGAGKSLCFQIPALLLDGPTLVIYPLLALMADQQRRMQEGNLKSVMFRGGMSKEDYDLNFKKIQDGAKIIIANPEVLQNPKLIEDLKSVGIVHITIDEAHCVSEWGDSFRPAYLGLGDVIKKLDAPLITAFTATASGGVLERVSQILFDGMAHVVRSESDRANIHYFVRRAGAKEKEALFLAKTELKPMIIFCGTRDKCENMAQELNVFFGKRIAKFYHAGLEKCEKDEVEKWFYDSKDGILCATCAYGMGVDKKDIKTVVHLETPKTAEAYIQEAGRGGRDGSIAKAFLIWSLEDSMLFGEFSDDSRESSMRLFAETDDCRRQVLLDALGGEKAYCEGCDLCLNVKQVDVDYELVCSFVRKNRNYFSEDSLNEKIVQFMNEKSRAFSGLNIWTHLDSAKIISQLVKSKKIIRQNYFWKNRLKIGDVRKKENVDS